MSPGNYLVSPSGYFFMILRADGNLMVHRGSGPEATGALWWSTNKTATGPVFATLYPSGNLAVAKGTGLHDDSAMVWVSPTGGYTGFDYVLALQDDGNVVVFKGSDPARNTGILWQTGKKIPVTQIATKMTSLIPLREGQKIGLEARAKECLKADNSGWTLGTGGGYTNFAPYFAVKRPFNGLEFSDLLTVEIVPPASGDTIFYASANVYQKLRLRTAAGGYLRYHIGTDGASVRTDATQATADIFVINTIFYDTGIGVVPFGSLVGQRDKILVTNGGYCGGPVPYGQIDPGPIMSQRRDAPTNTAQFFNIWVMP